MKIILDSGDFKPENSFLFMALARVCSLKPGEVETILEAAENVTAPETSEPETSETETAEPETTRGEFPLDDADETVHAIDAEGLPWDVRIHASTKTTLKNGTWKLKRGVDAETVETVKAELKAAASAPTIAPPPPPPVVEENAAPAPMAFGELAAAIAGASEIHGRETVDARVAAALQGVKIPNLGLLATRPDLVPAVAATLSDLLP